MEASQSEMASSPSAAGTAVPNDNHAANWVAPGRGRTDIVAVPVAGVPVHAVAASQDKATPAAVFEALLQAPGRPVLVAFANPSTAVLARHAPAFGRDLLSFDFVFPDGNAMCTALRSLNGLPAQRVSFDMTSLAPPVFEPAHSKCLAVVLVGDASGVAERARERIAATYPGLRVTGVLSGYGDMHDTMRQAAALSPDILACGMGNVRQEAFLLGMRALGWRGWGSTCGGFLDQLHVRLHYDPTWLDRANLRWAYRLFREPGRLWHRYLIQYTQFAWLVCAARIRQ